MELPKYGVVQFMPAYLEVPLGAVEGAGFEIIKPLYSMHEGYGTVQLRPERYGVRSGDLFPLLTETIFIQKHNREILDVMFFHVAVLEPGTSPKG